MPLHLAVEAENLATITLLMEQGAMPNAQDCVSSQAWETWCVIQSSSE